MGIRIRNTWGHAAGMLAILAIGGPVAAATVPFSVTAGLFDQADTVALGLSSATGTETFTVFKPSATADHYANGVALVGFKGYLYCQWQSSAIHEDSSDTWVAFSRSADGKTWSVPARIAGPGSSDYKTSGGWWVNGDTLVAYVNVWKSSTSPRGGNAFYATSTDGTTWSALKALPMSDGTAMNGIVEQDPHALPDGRIVNAAHFQPGLLVSPIYTDDKSGIRGWKRASYTNLAVASDVSRELEPSWFRRGDGAVVMVFRDQNTTYTKLASVSTDRGASWSTTVQTAMPDSRAKQSAGNLPDGTAFLVSNPVTGKRRSPLVVTLSKDGQTFDKAWVLRKGGADLQAQKYAGKAKTLGYSYPKSTIWNGFLVAGYSVNKEDVQVTRVPVASVSLNSTGIGERGGAHGTGAPRVRSLGGGFEVEGEGMLRCQILSTDGRLVATASGLDAVRVGDALRPGLYVLRIRTAIGERDRLVSTAR